MGSMKTLHTLMFDVYDHFVKILGNKEIMFTPFDAAISPQHIKSGEILPHVYQVMSKTHS